ncbi:MAG: alpha/beta hydrolase family protein [Pseudomonadota bacterium]
MRRLPALVLLFGVALGGGVPYMAAAQEPETPQEAPADEPAATPRPSPQTRGAALAEGLQRQLEAAAQLQLGDEEKFLALWQPANTPKARGVLVIVPSEGETADWPRAIGPLRRGLPEHGWHTLSLTPTDSTLSPGPRPPATEAPTAEEKSGTEKGAEPNTSDAQAAAQTTSAGYLPEQTAATDNDDSTPPQAEQDTPPPTDAERMLARLHAAIEHARTLQAPMIVLLGHGTGAYWASQYLAQRQPKDVGRIVVIDPRAPLQAEQPLESLVAALPVGIGDFYTGTRAAAKQQALQRRNAARRAGHPDYRQVALPNLGGGRDADQEQLVRRVRGWLERKPVR